MAITTKRIINLDTAASVASDDYIVLDGTTNGTRKLLTDGKGLSTNDYTDAEKAQVSDLKADLDAIREVELPIGTMTTGVYINGTGGESSDSGSKATDYIYIGDRVTNTLELRDVFVRGSRCCAIYNASKTFVRYISDGTDTRDFTVTLAPDEQYIRITARVADTPRAYFNKIIKRATAYVSNANGDDSNDGTLYAPYKTIQKAVDNGHKNIFVDATSEYSNRVYLYNLSDITIQPWFYRTYAIVKTIVSNAILK